MVLRKPTTITNPELADTTGLNNYAAPAVQAPLYATEPTDTGSYVLPSFTGIGTTPDSNYVVSSPLARDPSTGVVGNINPATGQMNQPGTEGTDAPIASVNPNPPQLVQPGTGDPYYGLGPGPGDPNDLSGLGFDPEYSAVQRRLEAALARQQVQADEDTSATQADIGLRRRNMQQQHPQDLKNLLEGFAGRGMAYSGRYANDVGENENAYAGALTGLDTEQAGRLSAIQRALSNFKADQEPVLEDAKLAYVRKRAADASDYAARLAAARGV